MLMISVIHLKYSMKVLVVLVLVSKFHPCLKKHSTDLTQDLLKFTSHGWEGSFPWHSWCHSDVITSSWVTNCLNLSFSYVCWNNCYVQPVVEVFCFFLNHRPPQSLLWKWGQDNMSSQQRHQTEWKKTHTHKIMGLINKSK